MKKLQSCQDDNQLLRQHLDKKDKELQQKVLPNNNYRVKITRFLHVYRNKSIKTRVSMIW